jgi:phage tail sheath gpL-like
MAVLRTLQANATQRCAQKLIVDDGTPLSAGAPAISPSIERMNIYHDYLQMEDLLWVEDSDDFLTGLIVTRDANDPTRLDVLFDPHIVSGLHIYAVLNQFYLRAGATASAAST